MLEEDLSQPSIEGAAHQSGGVRFAASARIQSLRDIAGHDIIHNHAITTADELVYQEAHQRRDEEATAIILGLHELLRTTRLTTVDLYLLHLVARLPAAGVTWEKAPDIVFEQLVMSLREQRMDVPLHFLRFCALIVQLLPTSHRPGLEIQIESYVERNRLTTKEAFYRDRDALLQASRALRSSLAILSIEIDEDPREQTYLVIWRLKHPALAPGSTLARTHELLVRTPAELPTAIGQALEACRSARAYTGGFAVEIALSSDRLAELSDVWDVHRWLCLSLSPRGAATPLAMTYPVSFRLNRDSRNALAYAEELWRAKSQRVREWIEAVHSEPPRIIHPHPDHRCYYPLPGWQHDHVVAMVDSRVPASINAPDHRDALANMLDYGLPIGVWIQPGADEHTVAQYLEPFYSAVHLRDLHQMIFDARLYNQATALQTILYYDLWDEADDNSLIDPHQE